ncbi:hypothetical protein [Nocardioides currus]|uniref:Secreted protein n=1 Tax=Nocardioides currus TaxID=2133958 RepID=A0A2R7YZ95_9ACTN|nr:hypothetical protein [Nocardioides currus]PUA81356.1 hypothetical protein C7S10_10100 [Nocardioides currus]
MKRKISILLGALLSSFVIVSVPSGPASAATCSESISEDGQRYTALCSSGPLVRYRAYVICTNDTSRFGPARYYGTGVPSVTECTGTSRIKYSGIQALQF